MTEISRTSFVAQHNTLHCSTITNTATRSSRLETQVSANTPMPVKMYGGQLKLVKFKMDVGQLKLVTFIMSMDDPRLDGCTLKITNIPRDMDLRALRGDMESYGTLVRWATPPGPVHVYAAFETTDMARAAMAGLRENRRLVVENTVMYG